MSAENSHAHEQIEEPRWKRRAVQGMQPKINTYHKRIVLTAIRTTLLAIGGQPLLDRFIGGCFGHLLAWRENKTCAKSLHALVSHEIESDSPDEIWFNIGGENVRFSYIEYAVVSGLRFGVSGFDPSGGPYNPTDSGVYTRFCLGQPISLRSLLDRFTRQLANKDNHDDYLKVANILMLYIFLIGFPDVRRVEAWAWVLVDDLDMWDIFPWGAYTYGSLMHYIGFIPKEKKKVKTVYHFAGPAWILQVWSYEVLPELARECAELVSPDAIPRALRWFFLSSKKKGKDFAALFNQIKPQPLQRIEGESNTHYWNSTQTAHPFGVRFIIPRNSITEGKGQEPGVRRARRTIDSISGLGQSPSADTGRTLRPRRGKVAMPGQDYESDDDDNTDHSVSRTRSYHIDKGKRVREPRSSSSSGDYHVDRHKDRRENRFLEKIRILNLEMMRQMKKEIVDDIKDWFKSVWGSRHSSSRHSPPPMQSPQHPTSRQSRHDEIGSSHKRGGTRSQERSQFLPSPARHSMPEHMERSQFVPSPARHSMPEQMLDLNNLSENMNNVAEVTYANPITTIMPIQTNEGGDYFTMEPIGQQRAHSNPLLRVSTRETRPSSSVRSPYVRDRPNDIPIKFRSIYEEFRSRGPNAYVTASLNGLTINQMQFSMIEDVKTKLHYNWAIDLYIDSLKMRIRSFESPHPGFDMMKTRIINSEFFCIMREAWVSNNENPWSTAYEVVKEESWNPPPNLIGLVRGLVGDEGYWWNVTNIIVPCLIDDNWLIAHCHIDHWRIDIHDPMFHKLDRAGKVMRRVYLRPLAKYMAPLLKVAGYWYSNTNRIPEKQLPMAIKHVHGSQQYKQKHEADDLPLACMIVDRIVFGVPSIAWATREQNMVVYRKNIGAHIFRVCDV